MKSFSNAESDKHAIAKYTLYHSLRDHKSVTKCELERNLGTVKPDISAYIGEYPVAVEIQVSNLSVEKIIHRTNEYTRKGIYVLWLCTNYTVGGVARREVFLTKWMRFLSGMYFGNVYYPQSDGLILSTRVNRIKRVESSDWGTSVRTLKTLREVVDGETKHIVDGFKPIIRDEFNDFPRARLWTVK